MFPEINIKAVRPEAPQQHKIQAEGNRMGCSRPYQQNPGKGAGTALPYLESRPLAVSNAKTHHQPARTHLPNIPSKNTPSDERSSSHPLGMSPTEALASFKDRLTDFEQEEIAGYAQIWYLGLDAKKIRGCHLLPHNAGYDDEQGGYLKVTHDHIGYRYEMLDEIGKGSFGQVLKCRDHKTNENVAIKVIRNKKRFHHQSMMELKILETLRRKDKDNSHNVVHMKEHFYFRNHLCISFELLGLNLYELIKKNNYHGFSQTLVRRFADSLLKCLQMLYKEKIIHCDLKPENILMSSKGQGNVKVIDFGSSCYEQQRIYTYIQSRFYRSPEVILGHPYSMAIDMWSLGCLLVEMYTGFPLFAGESEIEQIACMLEVLGMPPNHFLQTATRKRLFFDSKGNPRNITNSKGRKRRPDSKDLASVLNTNDSQFLDFIQHCLTWDPKKRMTPEEAMQHQWIQEVRYHKTRPKIRSVRKPADSHSGVGNNAAHPSHRPAAIRTVEKQSVKPADRPRRENSEKIALSERLRPIGASAEGGEDRTKGARAGSSKQEVARESTVHIVIRPPTTPVEESNSPALSQELASTT